MNLKLDKRFAKQPQQALAFRRIVAVCLKRGNALFLLGDPSLGIGDVPVGLSEVFDLRHWIVTMSQGYLARNETPIAVCGNGARLFFITGQRCP